jgi:glycosyltransferase involved in cell wall biosynthesis
MSRKLLLVTYHFPPSAASGTFRMLGFARHLPRHGWHVHVVAPPETPWDNTDPALAAQVPRETGYDAVPYPRWAPRLMRLLAPYAMWLPLAWRACRRAIERDRPDVVLTSGPPHVVHWLGMLLKRVERLPWIADFRDPWITDARDPWRTGAARARRTLKQRWLYYSEKQVFAHADRILANAPNARGLFCHAYPRQCAKIVTLTNGFDPPAQATPPPPLTGTLRMLHAGEIYAGRDPLPLLDAMAELKQAGHPLRLVVMGNVHLPRGNLADEAAQRGLASEVDVRGQLPYQEALQEMAQTDLLVLLDAPGRTVGVPAKLYEYLGAGRPILALAEPDGDTAQVLRDSGMPHRIAPPKEVGHIREAIAELREAPATMVDPERLRQFTRHQLAGDLAAIMEQVTSRK